MRMVVGAEVKISSNNIKFSTTGRYQKFGQQTGRSNQERVSHHGDGNGRGRLPRRLGGGEYDPPNTDMDNGVISPRDKENVRWERSHVIMTSRQPRGVRWPVTEGQRGIALMG